MHPRICTGWGAMTPASPFRFRRSTSSKWGRAADQSHGSMRVGGCEWVLETTVNYAKERVQFGVPIGSFQSIKHKCADIYSAIEYARSLMEWAAEAVREDAPDAALAVSMAKSFCGDAYKLVTDHGVQVHGGIGFTWDHDMHLYFKRARSSDTAYGDSTYHRELVAQAFD